ncbi:(alpha)-aspartyl dipeptidase [Nonlabens sp. YIK11]|uniref:dipeptidase PepE n=1 Tax=Nonlabens sp. YIK11 TaxID=1453349 RepID=UPI0006DCFEA3|nr:dipeptidase PepE [Nonlabens sp. YIK11]KQC32644.1 (alpha)-aspartyl dipeptidase [Nonlabens sp. YIK11]
MRNMIVASTSTLYGGGYLEYLTPFLSKRLKAASIKELLFIPFARPGGISHDDYTSKVRAVFQTMDVNVKGVHEFEDPIKAIQDAQGIFTGGGNTFQLIKMLHDLQLIEPLRKAIYQGIFYLGTSAGSNICGLNIRTTNDMPVVQPSSFKATGALAYNINPHYQDPIEGDQHMGETREQRINEFHIYNHIPVIGLREGSFIDVQGTTEILKGTLKARLFQAGKAPIEIEPETDFATLNLNH